MKGRVLLLALAIALPVAVPGGASASELEISLSNFRFCAGRPACTPADTGYVRQQSGPVGETRTPLPIQVEAGSVVRFVYRDATGCDLFAGCAGHDVHFENGTADGGPQLGFAPARSGETGFSVRIPEDAAGSSIFFFCDVNDHWSFGMTGIFQVA